MKNTLLFIIGIITISMAFSGCSLYSPTISDLQVGKAVDDESKEVTEPQDSMPSNTAYIYASILLRNGKKDTIIKGTWSREGIQIGEPTEISAQGNRYIAFTMKKPLEGFRPGEYKITIELIDTGQTETKTFQIEPILPQ